MTVASGPACGQKVPGGQFGVEVGGGISTRAVVTDGCPTMSVHCANWTALKQDAWSERSGPQSIAMVGAGDGVAFLTAGEVMTIGAPQAAGKRNNQATTTSRTFLRRPTGR